MSTTIAVVEDREVVLTSGVSESGYHDALGYFVVDASGVAGPDVLVFTNDDVVPPGTRFDLGFFPAESHLGFFILQDGGTRLTGDEQARITALPRGFAVSFEDLLADPDGNPRGLAPDGDFNDVVFNLGFEAGPAARQMQVVFVAGDGINGTEPWVSDGTTSGTHLLLDINPGSESSNPTALSALGNGRALFSANDGVSGTEPWITDGTADGTHLLRDVNSGTDSSGLFGSFTALGDGRALFPANDGFNGSELWITDGTSTGTTLLKDINPGSGSSSLFGLVPLGAGQALFAASAGGSSSPVFWTTDGTTAGTQPLPNISAQANVPPFYLNLGNGHVLFKASDSLHGSEPWITDGTSQGTHLLADIVPGPNGSLSDVASIALGNGRALFTATGGIWVTDGTEGGTRQVVDNALSPPFLPGQRLVGPFVFSALGDGRALFVARDSVDGNEPWITDGTLAGTHLILDINPGAGSSSNGGQQFSIFGNGQALFAANDGVSGTEPWITDGTTGGTHLVLDINPGSNSSGPFVLAALDVDHVLFAATDDASGRGVWVTDGTAEGTNLLLNVTPVAGIGGVVLLGTSALSSDHPFV